MPQVTLELDLSKLENIKRHESGEIHAACPACRATGSDKSGHHLFIQSSGKFGCAAHPGDAAHRKEIFRLAGVRVAENAPVRANITAPPGKSQIVCAYDYQDASGKLIFQVVRFHPKTFRQRQPDGKGGWRWKMEGVEKVLFRLPEILRAVQRGQPVFICEGERDVEEMAQRGFDATCNPGGAGKWQNSFSETLRGADVAIIADKDKAGRDHAQLVAGKLHGVAKSVRVIELPDVNGQPVKDAADFFTAGGVAAQILQLADAAPVWKSPDTAPNSRRADVAREYLSAEAEKTATATAASGVPATREDLTEFEFANLLAAKLPPIKTVGKDWFAYRDGAWQKIHRATLRPAALDILPPIIRKARLEATLLDHLEGRNQVPPDAFRGFYRFDGPDAVLINAENGIVRVTADAEPELLPHGESHLFTQRTAARFDPQAGAELFLAKLGEMLPDELDRDLLQLCFGNFLLPDCRFEVALVCYGEAGRGKSTIAEPIAAAMGGELVTRLSLNQICDSRSYHLPKLRFAAVNLGTELDVIAVDESANFKTIVSGEPGEARPIYGEPFTMQTACKLWFLANGLPRFKNGTEAELRRTRFIRFDHKPTAKDVTLKNRLLAERDGVFNFMLAGLKRLLTLPEIPLGGAESQAVHARFKISNDPLGSFVAAHCEFDAEARESKETLKSAFLSFCETHGTPADFGDFFFKRLYERFTTLREVRTWNGGERVRTVAGIRLKSILETE